MTCGTSAHDLLILLLCKLLKKPVHSDSTLSLVEADALHCLLPRSEDILSSPKHTSLSDLLTAVQIFTPASPHMPCEVTGSFCCTVTILSLQNSN